MSERTFENPPVKKQPAPAAAKTPGRNLDHLREEYQSLSRQAAAFDRETTVLLREQEASHKKWLADRKTAKAELMEKKLAASIALNTAEEQAGVASTAEKLAVEALGLDRPTGEPIGTAGAKLNAWNEVGDEQIKSLLEEHKAQLIKLSPHAPNSREEAVALLIRAGIAVPGVPPVAATGRVETSPPPAEPVKTRSEPAQAKKK